MQGCNQQDFLPFKCSLCSKNLCLLHRSPVAHNCVSGGVVDVISVACPICGKSIKMNRNDDPNIEWNHHFATACDHTPPTSQPPNRCAAPNCTTVLGPSNQIKCNICHRQVCLSHRSADAHKCKELKRADMLQNQIRTNPNMLTPRTQSNSSKTTNSKPTTSTNRKSQAAKPNKPDPSNTLQGTAHRRQQQQSVPSTNSHQADVEPCPICGLTFSSLRLLTAHLDEQHLNGNDSTTVAAPIPAPTSRTIPTEPALTTLSGASSSSISGREVCPQCSLQFDNIVDLIQHVERAHPHGPGDATSKENCKLC
jgi:predicted nucleic acid binding AN1-type Zn finger protein